MRQCKAHHTFMLNACICIKCMLIDSNYMMLLVIMWHKTISWLHLLPPSAWPANRSADDRMSDLVQSVQIMWNVTLRMNWDWVSWYQNLHWSRGSSYYNSCSAYLYSVICQHCLSVSYLSLWVCKPIRSLFYTPSLILSCSCKICNRAVFVQ